MALAGRCAGLKEPALGPSSMGKRRRLRAGLSVARGEYVGSFPEAQTRDDDW